MQNDVITKLSKFALASSYAGLVTVGVCPAFGIIGIVVGLVLQMKMKDLADDVNGRIKSARIAGIISLVLFPADVILAYVFLNK